MKIKSIKASGDNVILSVVSQEKKLEEKKLDSGIILPVNAQKQSKGQSVNVEGEKKTVAFYVFDIGPGVDATKVAFKKDDEVFVNPYDIQTFGDDTGALYAVCASQSIKAVIESVRD